LNCYAVGDISALSESFDVYVGGLVGSTSANGNAVISNCFAGGNISAQSVAGRTNYVGGLAGYRCPSTSVTNSYRFEGQTFYNKEGSYEYNTASNVIGTSCTLAELNSVNFYTSTLDWSDEVWDLVGLDFANGKYPKLK